MTELVFLHGWLGHPQDWQEIVEDLSEYQSRCPELPRAASWEAGIRELLPALADDHVLIGYSLGARLALGCALGSRSRLRGLVLISGTAGLPAPARTQRWQRDQRLAAELSSRDPVSFLTNWYRNSVFRGLDSTTQERLVREKLGLDFSYHADLLRAYSVGQQPRFWARLRSLRMPVLILVGERDAKFIAIGRRLHRRLPNARFRVIAKAGHAVHREQPGAVAHELREFLVPWSEEIRIDE
jgi:2-succinyl-6-hydroxy-2,4-cyclohexadiene-1-carboxylate synthase